MRQQSLCILIHKRELEQPATSQEIHMQKVLHINPDKCTGCLQCEMACSFENYGTYATSKSRIK
eukprot:gene37279-48736_t